MKKILILLVLTSFFLFSCSLGNGENKESSSLSENPIAKDDNSKQDEDKENSSLSESSIIENSSLSESSIIEDDSSKSNENNLSINSPTSSKLQLYEGVYFDSRVYTEGPKLTHYFEVLISNITETSFDFSFYEVDRYTNEKKIIFNKNTAIFIEDGTLAAFYGKDYTLNFTFPDGHKSHPVVTDIQISGFLLLDGLTFFNNSIPGHEFG